MKLKNQQMINIYIIVIIIISVIVASIVNLKFCNSNNSKIEKQSNSTYYEGFNKGVEKGETNIYNFLYDETRNNGTARLKYTHEFNENVWLFCYDASSDVKKVIE